MARRVKRRRDIARTGEEALKILRTNLLLSVAELGSPTVIITSPNAGEGKSTTTVGVAEAIARAGGRVVVVDFDLRHPNVHKFFRLVQEPGVTDVLLERAPLERALQYVTLGRGPGRSAAGLYVLPAGRPVDNPAELLGTDRTARLLDTVASQADIVLIDTPPVLPVADTLVIGRLAAGAVLVVRSRATAYPAAQAAKNALARNQTRILGMVVNEVDDSDLSYGYGYGYDAQPEGGFEVSFGAAPPPVAGPTTNGSPGPLA